MKRSLPESDDNPKQIQKKRKVEAVEKSQLIFFQSEFQTLYQHIKEILEKKENVKFLKFKK
jgi:DNA-directed RNA polymerase subunit L